MEAALEAIIVSLTTGEGAGKVALSLGWVFFIIERYWISPRRETEFQATIKEFRASYKDMGDKMAETLARFSVILEVIKDRMER